MIIGRAVSLWETSFSALCGASEATPAYDASARVRQIGRARKLSQERVALKAEIDRSYLRQIERGESNVSLINIHRIAKALGVEAAELFRALAVTAHQAALLLRGIAPICYIHAARRIAVTLDELFADLNLWEEAASKPRDNPQMPAEGNRSTYVITFDWGQGDTDGMLDVLRRAGFWAIAKPRYPRTTIICRTPKTTTAIRVRRIVSSNLEDHGSAMVMCIGADKVWIWPDKPWPGEDEKLWRWVAE